MLPPSYNSVYDMYIFYPITAEWTSQWQPIQERIQGVFWRSPTIHSCAYLSWLWNFNLIWLLTGFHEKVGIRTMPHGQRKGRAKSKNISSIIFNWFKKIYKFSNVMVNLAIQFPAWGYSYHMICGGQRTCSEYRGGGYLVFYLLTEQ